MEWLGVVRHNRQFIDNELLGHDYGVDSCLFLWKFNRKFSQIRNSKFIQPATWLNDRRCSRRKNLPIFKKIPLETFNGGNIASRRSEIYSWPKALAFYYRINRKLAIGRNYGRPCPFYLLSPIFAFFIKRIVTIQRSRR